MVVILTSRLIFSTSYSLDVAVAAERLNGGVGARVGRLRREELGERTFHLQVGLAGVEAGGHVLDVGPGGLELGDVGQ